MDAKTENNTSPLSQPSPQKTLPTIPSDIADKIASNKLMLTISDKNGFVESTSMAELFKKGPMILTSTPSPFLPGEELPSDFLDTAGARGCTKQLQKCHEVTRKPELGLAEVYAINVRPINIQVALLNNAEKNIGNLKMIGFPDEKTLDDFIRECNFPVLEINGGKYLARFSIAVNAEGKAKLFLFKNKIPDAPINDDDMKLHLAAIDEFFGVKPQLESGSVALQQLLS